MRKLMLASLLSLTAIGVSGCVLVGPGNTQLKFGNAVVGELHAQSGGTNGYLVTLYAPITGAIRAMHNATISLNDGNGHLVHCGGPQTDQCTLRWLRTFDGSAEWHRATADSEGGDFHDALFSMPHPNVDCLAVQIYLVNVPFRDSENWTYRHQSDSSCTP
jgi:hypothetical protein